MPTAELNLRSARRAARVALRIAADWLRSSGGTAPELDALRAAYRALEAADPEQPDRKWEFPLV